MNAIPETKAGDGSSLNMVSRFIGGAVGVAAVGSVLASIYTSRLSDAVGALSPGNADKAQGSIQGGLEVAQSLPNPAQECSRLRPRDAFDNGATAGYLVVAGLAFLATVWAWFALGVPPSETSVGVTEAARRYPVTARGSDVDGIRAGAPKTSAESA